MTFITSGHRCCGQYAAAVLTGLAAGAERSALDEAAKVARRHDDLCPAMEDLDGVKCGAAIATAIEALK